MRLAVLSDIHANLQALTAVRADLATQGPDSVVVAGDFVNRGPQPHEVWQLLQNSGWTLLRGNHEDYVSAQSYNKPIDDALVNPIWQPARWTAEQLGRDASDYAHLPISIRFSDPGGGEVVIAHGSERRNNEGIFPHTTESELDDLLGDDPPQLFCCGHTHVALLRQHRDTLIVNAGSIGMPFNGDARAQYAIVTWSNGQWRAELRQIEYDREACVRSYNTHHFLQGGGPLARIILYELQTARPHLSSWVRTYTDPIHKKEISVAAAVDAYLAAAGAGTRAA